MNVAATLDLPDLETMTIGARLRELREAKGLTQEALARAADVGLSVVFRIEQERVLDPAWSTICALADGLGVPVTEFRKPPILGRPSQRRGRPRKN